MAGDRADGPHVLPTSTVTVPEHVVYRGFAAETVLLNLETGQYHGVNPTGGRMLDVLETAETVGDAATQLADEYDRPRDEVERDLREFCAGLAERGLLEIHAAKRT